MLERNILNEKCLARLIKLSVVISFFFMQGCVLFDKEELPLPGYNTGSDVYEETLEEHFNDIWEAAIYVLEDMGEIAFKEPGVGRIEANIEHDHVTLRLYQIRKKFAKIRIQAYQRRTYTPHAALAERTLQRIKHRIEELN